VVGTQEPRISGGDVVIYITKSLTQSQTLDVYAIRSESHQRLPSHGSIRTARPQLFSPHISSRGAVPTES